MDADQRWIRFHRGQPLWNLLNAGFFEYGIAAYDLEIDKHLTRGRTGEPEFRGQGPLPKALASAWRKALRLSLPNRPVRFWLTAAPIGTRSPAVRVRRPG